MATLELTSQDVLDFWFGARGSPQYGTRRKPWFRKSDAFDQEIRERFLDLYEAATSGDLIAWDASRYSLLALIIVLDQFPRNMFRGTGRAFASDAQALKAAQRMVERGWDQTLLPVERQFAYLPFQHAEDLSMQQRALDLFGSIAADAAYADLVVSSRRHYDIIARFGRFPHRNALLERASSAVEEEFLAQPGSSF